MSREMRRLQAKKEKRQVIAKGRRVGLSSIQLEFEAFDSIERLFIQIRNGELGWNSVDMTWEIMSLSGEMMDVVSALEGWIRYWKTVTETQSITYYSDDALRKLHASLKYCKPLQLKEVDAAYQVINHQRHIYRTTPRELLELLSNRMREILKTEYEISLYSRQIMSAGMSTRKRDA